MTNDEVIAWIDEEVTETDILISTNWSMFLSTGDKKFAKETRKCQRYRASLLANRDVLVRHKVDEENYLRRYAGNDNQVRYEMCMCEEDFPCPTYQAITNRIRKVM